VKYPHNNWTKTGAGRAKILLKRAHGKCHLNMLRYISCVLLLIFWTSAQAVEIEIASKRYPIESAGVKAFLPYESSHDLFSKNDFITRVIYSIHSSSYSAKSYFNRSAALVDKAPTQKNKTLIIAPHLLKKGHLSKLEDKKILHWEISPFWGSSKGMFDDKRLRISSYEVTDRILEQVVTGGNFPNLKTIIILGHSAGGQMTNRYAATGIFESEIANPRKIEVRYIVMAPASYVYFDGQRAVKGTINKFSVPNDPPANYNRWGKGLEELYTYHRKHKITPKLIVDRYPSKKILYLVGGKDNNVFGSSPASMLLGKHRLERGRIYYNYLKHFYGDKIKGNQYFKIVKNAGHSGGQLMRSKQAILFTFAPNSKEEN